MMMSRMLWVSTQMIVSDLQSLWIPWFEISNFVVGICSDMAVGTLVIVMRIIHVEMR